MTNVTNVLKHTMAPVVKVNRLAASNLETFEVFQKCVLQGYVDFGMAQLKAAAAPVDMNNWREYVSGRVDACKDLHRVLVNDTNVLIELTRNSIEDFLGLVNDTVVESTSNAVKKAA